MRALVKMGGYSLLVAALFVGAVLLQSSGWAATERPVAVDPPTIVCPSCAHETTALFHCTTMGCPYSMEDGCYGTETRECHFRKTYLGAECRMCERMATQVWPPVVVQ